MAREECIVAFDPEKIIVEDTGTEFLPRNDSTRTTQDIRRLRDAVGIHQSWGMRIPEQGGTAWIRITPALRDFFKLCNEKHGVIGFEYDFEEGGLNFGLVLKKEGHREPSHTTEDTPHSS